MQGTISRQDMPFTEPGGWLTGELEGEGGVFLVCTNMQLVRSLTKQGEQEEDQVEEGQ